MTNMSLNKQTIAFTSVISYTLATYVLVAPAFTVNQFTLPQWLSFMIVSIPFGGRIIGSLLYQRLVSIIGSRLTYLISILALGLFSLGSSINIVAVLISLRLLVGVAFGIATSLAVEQAMRSENKIIIALTMSGWAFGWIMGAFSYLELKDWSLIAISGIITIPFSLLYRGLLNFNVEENKFSLPSLSSILIFFFSFEPAFVLQLAPSIVEDENGISWLILGYIVSIPMYILMPSISRFLGETKTAIIYTSTSAITGVLFFVTSLPYILVIFTAFGLGINAIAPRLASVYGATARSVGIALNTAAIGGVIVPVVASLNIKIIASLFTALSMVVLLILAVRKRNAMYVRVH